MTDTEVIKALEWGVGGRRKDVVITLAHNFQHSYMNDTIRSDQVRTKVLRGKQLVQRFF